MKSRVLILVTQLLDDGPSRVIQGILRHIDSAEWHITIGYLYGSREGEAVYREMGVSTLCFDMKGPFNAWGDISVLKKLSHFIVREKIQLLHTHLVRSDVFGRIAARRVGIPVISTIHNMESHHSGKGVKETIVRVLDKKTISFCDIVITVSEALKNYIHSIYDFPLEKLVCIHNGIDVPEGLTSTLTRKDLSFEDHSPLIGTVARLHPQKGIDTFIEAVRLIRNKGMDVNALIIGDGPLKEELLNYVNEKGLENIIVFAGFKKDVYQYINLMDVFVLPSRWEGFGVSIIESMAMGKPVVASKVGGIPEIVDNGVTGFLVEPDHVDAFADAIVRLLKDNSLMKKLGEAGKDRYQYLFRAAMMSERYQDIYRAAIQ